MGRAVIVAKRDQRPDLQPQALGRLRSICALELILHDGRVLAVDHEDRLLDHDAFDFISENGKRIEAEVREIAKALGMDNAGIAVAGEVKRLAVNQQRLFQLGQEHFPADRRLGGGDQQAMIAARVQTGDGGRGKAAQAVGFQPFAAQGRIQVAAGFLLN